MLCSISGEVPEVPVVSMKTGHVFEKRLIEKHLKAVGTCPVTKEELHEKDLLPVKSNDIVRPRPPTATSIPGMMSVFQKEWDSLMLETYTLKQHLDATRTELAHALYQHDAACRVIARLQKERDAARAALGDSKGNVNVAAMEDDEEEEELCGLTEKVKSVMTATAKALTADRKKRIKALAANVVKTSKPEDFKQLSTHSLHTASKPGIRCLDLHPKQQNLVLTGGNDNHAVLFDRDTKKVADTLRSHSGKVTDVAFHPSSDVLLTSSLDSSVVIWRKEGAKFKPAHKLAKHTDAVNALSLHPSGDYFVTASSDKSYGFFDIESGLFRDQVKHEGAFSNIQFHPDGVLLATAAGKKVQIFDAGKRQIAAKFEGHDADITSVAFSENGYYLATADAAGVVHLRDLRKLKTFHTIKSDDISVVKTLSFDASGSFLAVGGNDLRVYSSKGWGELAVFDSHKDVVNAVKFGQNASFLVSGGGPKDRQLKFFGV